MLVTSAPFTFEFQSLIHFDADVWFVIGTLLDGKPIITLPPKSIHLTKVDFSAEERAFYNKLEADSRSQFKVLVCSLYEGVIGSIYTYGTLVRLIYVMLQLQ